MLRHVVLGQDNQRPVRWNVAVIDREDERSILSLGDAHLAAQLVPQGILGPELVLVFVRASGHPVVIPGWRAQLVLRQVMHGGCDFRLVLDLALESALVLDRVDLDGDRAIGVPRHRVGRAASLLASDRGNHKGERYGDRGGNSSDGREPNRPPWLPRRHFCRDMPIGNDDCPELRQQSFFELAHDDSSFTTIRKPVIAW